MRVELTPGYSISRIVKGGWQLAAGHGAPVEEDAAARDMAAFADAGITTFDGADIYQGVEEAIGRFLERSGRRDVQVHTKYVPDLGSLETVDLGATRAIVERSRNRLRIPALDLVQFHWWDYAIPRYLETAMHLKTLRDEGLIRRLGATNFDTRRLGELLNAGAPIVSHQVQYSLLDRRPAGSMTALCGAAGVSFLCYGSLLGGFLSERWLGAPEPREPFENRSLVKYKLVIDESLGWDGFQNLLRVARGVGRKHGVGIGAVGIAWVLIQPNVAAAIVGARHARHLEDCLAALKVRLDASDMSALAAASGRGMPGEVYELERDREGRHGRVMKYNLNRT